MSSDFSVAQCLRVGHADELAAALQSSRRTTLSLLDAYVAALGPELAVPYSVELNPPRWEVGHVAWFQDLWIARNRQRHRGAACDPDHPRLPSRLPGADALYDSSHVAHQTRWRLPLPELGTTHGYLAASLAATLSLLADDAGRGEDLYFHRLVLFHEDMHAEAAIYMAQALGISLPEALVVSPRRLPAARDIPVAATEWTLGWPGEGFAFDNELPAHDVALSEFAIDDVPVSWRRFLPAVESGELAMPRYLRQVDGRWQALRFGAWTQLDLDTAAVHVSWPQAEAWCRWAGRRLPREEEWECAALSAPGFQWGDVWEWTASRFAPFDGFVAHPYRDYSRFGFEEHRYVLKGASGATPARMAHPKYRNFFPGERCDIHSGFRSCAR